MSTKLYCTISANPSPDLQAALKWAEAYNLRDVDRLMSTISDDYTHHLLPQSLAVKPRNKDQFREYFTSIIIPMFQDFTVTIDEIVEAPGKVLFHATSKATSTTGAPYATEYNILLYITPQTLAPPKVSLVKEFVDSKYSLEFFGAEKKRQAALEAASSKARI